jgi:hypothetical protein
MRLGFHSPPPAAYIQAGTAIKRHQPSDRADGHDRGRVRAAVAGLISSDGPAVGFRA